MKNKQIRRTTTTDLEASRCAQENDILFLETSALTGEGVEDVFIKVITFYNSIIGTTLEVESVSADGNESHTDDVPLLGSSSSSSSSFLQTEWLQYMICN